MGASTPPWSIALSRGYWLWRALAVHLPSRLSARCMLAGPVLPPLTAPARQRGCRGGDGVGGEGGVCHRAEQEGEKQLAGAAASILPSLLLLLLLQKVNPDPSTSLLLASLASSLQGEWSCRRGLASVWRSAGLSRCIFSAFPPLKSPSGYGWTVSACTRHYCRLSPPHLVRQILPPPPPPTDPPPAQLV